MELDELKFTLKRLYKEYVKEHFNRILLSLFLSIIVAASTAATAWLLDPAVKKIFIDKDRTLAWPTISPTNTRAATAVHCLRRSISGGHRRALGWTRLHASWRYCHTEATGHNTGPQADELREEERPEGVVCVHGGGEGEKGLTGRGIAIVVG